jgi:thiamine biosynthesis protein ThiS
MATYSTKSIEIVLNGEPREAPGGLSVAGLLEHLGIAADRVAVELEGEIIRRPRWEDTPVRSGARLEIVHFVGGG